MPWTGSRWYLDVLPGSEVLLIPDQPIESQVGDQYRGTFIRPQAAVDVASLLAYRVSSLSRKVFCVVAFIKTKTGEGPCGIVCNGQAIAGRIESQVAGRASKAANTKHLLTGQRRGDAKAVHMTVVFRFADCIEYMSLTIKALEGGLFNSAKASEVLNKSRLFVKGAERYSLCIR